MAFNPDTPPSSGFKPDNFQPDAVQPRFGEEFVNNLPSIVKQGIGALTSFRNGQVKGATLGYADLGKHIPAVAQAAEEHPNFGNAGEFVGATVPAAAASAALPIGEAAGYGEIAAKSGLQGAAQGAAHQADSLEQRGTNTGLGGLAGLILGPTVAAGARALGKGMRWVGKMGSGMDENAAQAYETDPNKIHGISKQMQHDSGRSEIDRQALLRLNSAEMAAKTKGLDADKTVKGLLQGENSTIDPSKYLGKSPEMDAEVQALIDKHQPHEMYPTGQPPNQLQVPSNDVRDLAQKFQHASDFVPSNSSDALLQKARAPEFARSQGELRDIYSRSGGDDKYWPIKSANQTMSDSFGHQASLRKALSTPAVSAKTTGLSKSADLYNAGDFADVDVRSLGHDLRAAESITPVGQDDRWANFLRNFAARGSLMNAKPLMQSTPSVPLSELLRSESDKR